MNESFIPMRETRSPTVQAIGYDEMTKILAVRHRGKVRYFRDVPGRIYALLLHATNKKELFERTIVPNYREFEPFAEIENIGEYTPDPSPEPIDYGDSDAEFRRKTAAVLLHHEKQEAALASELEISQGELESSRSELDRRCRENAALASQLETAESRLNDTKRRMSEAQKSLEKQKNDLINKMQRLKSQNASLSSQLESAQLLLTDTERRLNEARLYAAEVRNKAEKQRHRIKLFGLCLAFVCLISAFAVSDKLKSSYDSGYSTGYSTGVEEQTQIAEAAATSAKDSGSSSTNKSVIVFVTDSGTKYHRRGCSYLKSKHAMSLSDAIAAGYTPCSRCW